MGGWMSSTQSPKPSQGDLSVPSGTGYPPNNNNAGDVVIIPVDASKQAETAFLWYLQHAHRPENTVKVVHCEEITPTSPIMAEHTFRTESWVELVAKTKLQSSQILDKYEKRLREQDVNGTVEVAFGRPGETVIAAAERNNATMIVMGTRGLGLIRRTVLGSVSEYVLHHTKVPVTVIPNETTKWFF